MMTKKIRVTILDDHQSIIDGYLFRLGKVPEIEVVATIAYGEELEPTLGKFPTDVLLLDVSVPMSAINPNPYPILHVIPKLLELYPNLAVLVISMLAERGLIRAIMEAGANGYILKDDQATIRELGNVVTSVANGGIYFSQKAHQFFLSRHAQEPQLFDGRTGAKNVGFQLHSPQPAFGGLRQAGCTHTGRSYRESARVRYYYAGFPTFAGIID